MSRKTQTQKNKLLAEFAENPNITSACKKLGIHRSNYYRWCDEDPRFKADAAVAAERGRDRISDFAQSKLLENVANNNQQAIAFVLRHNSKQYRPHAIRLYLDENKRQGQELDILKALLNELIDKVGIDEAIRIAGHDPVEFRKKIKKELEAQDKPPDEL